MTPATSRDLQHYMDLILGSCRTPDPTFPELRTLISVPTKWIEEAREVLQKSKDEIYGPVTTGEPQ
jgi:hypothetical protein